ncbi:hypothetical protein SRHO_G00044410 [Serrasalmus rhombeus]
MESARLNTCSAPALSSYPAEPLCFLPGGGRDGADGWEDKSIDKKALERDRKRGKGPGVPPSIGLPHDYCTTPGGTLFSTTPGGTRIIYDRKFLLDQRNSPIAQTPPAHLPVIPGVTSQNVLNENKKNKANNFNNHDGKPGTGEDAQFEMDI